MTSWANTGPACPVCSAIDRDKHGATKHQAWCPHFMRGPDAGGDPHEWPSLLSAGSVEEAEER